MQDVLFPAILVDVLASIMLAFRAGVARHCPAVAQCRPARILIWRWLRRTERRLLSLIAAYRAGTLPPPEPLVPHTRKPSDPGAERPPVTRLVFINRVGWLFDLGMDFGFSVADLGNWLREPEVAAFVAAAPQAGRPLRGLLRAMGIRLPDYLKRRRRAERPKPPPRPPQGPPWPARYPPPEGELRPGEIWIKRLGYWITHPAGRPLPVGYE